MGEFRRSHSKVWWSHYPEEDEEDGAQTASPHWGPGLSLSGERRFSSSPSSGSHKSQDSGFSDSESSSPSGSTRSSSSSALRQHKVSKSEKEEGERPEESKTPEPRYVDPKILLQTPLSRIPRARLSHKPKTNSDPTVSPKIAPNDNLVLEVDKKDLEENAVDPCQCPKASSPESKSSVQNYLADCYFQISSLSVRPVKDVHSVSLNIQSTRKLPDLPIRFNSTECLLNEQNLFSNFSKHNNCDRNSSEDEDSDSCPPEVEPRRKSTCFIVEEIPKKSFVQPISISLSSSNSSCDQSSSNNSSNGKINNENKDCNSNSDLKNSLHSANSISDVFQLKCIPETESNTQVTNDSPKFDKSGLDNQNSTLLSVSDASSQLGNETARFIGNIDLVKSCNENNSMEKNVSSGLAKDKISKSCNLSWSPIKNGPDDLNYSSPNKTVVFDSVIPVNELPGAPTHTSTPKSVQVNVRRPPRKNIGRKELFQQSESYYNQDASAAQWLFELGTRYETECMTTLQNKCLISDSSRQVSVMVAASSQVVRDLQQRTKLISEEFSKLYRQIKRDSTDHLGPLVQSLVGHLNEFILNFRKSLADISSLISTEVDDLSKLPKACDQLKKLMNEIPFNFNRFASELSYIGKLYSQFVDHLLKFHIKSLIRVLEEPSSDVALLSALSGLTGLGLEGTHLASLVARCNGIRAILSVCLDARWTTVRSAALRTLATVCCSALSIRQLEKVGGIEILADLLGDEAKPETELSEAASVLAQITAPWIEDNHKVEGLQHFINTFVTALTRLVRKTKSSETLLLASAALANLSFMEPRAVYALLEMGSAGYLLAAVRKLGARASVFLQEQAATMIANMAAVPETREYLAKHRAVVALLCFLQIRPSPLQRSSEIAAAERLQHKSAIALSRLCSDPEVSHQVVELQGVSRLVRLCKEKRERNHSDAVLVACLAALRKITKNCGTTIMEEQDVSLLVEPRLLDSFLTYSSKQESYV